MHATTTALPGAGLFSCLGPRSPERISALNAEFSRARPFPHVAMDDFLSADFCAELVRQFPCPGKGYEKFCLGDDGRIGTNYSNSIVEEFPEAFQRLDRLIASPEFIDWLSKVTGIQGLEYDPKYWGGGVKESQSGTFLPAHRDFNYHPEAWTHRRLNMLLYLNPVWDASWGGNFQLHSDPYAAGGVDTVAASFEPMLNRCVIFETSETSWHGFDRLRPPQGVSRRTFAVYYYTKDRPGGAGIRKRNTEYAEPPLPGHLVEGRVLTEEDVASLREHFVRRDDRIRMLYDIRSKYEEGLSAVYKAHPTLEQNAALKEDLVSMRAEVARLRYQLSRPSHVAAARFADVLARFPVFREFVLRRLKALWRAYQAVEMAIRRRRA